MRNEHMMDATRNPEAAWPRLTLHRLALAMAITTLVALAPGCDEDEGPGTQCRTAKSGLVTLKVTDGVVFDTGVVTSEAEAMTSDLVSYKSGATIDLKSGIEVGTVDRVPLRWFRSAGGVGLSYDKLEAIPWEAPGQENLNEFLHGPEAGFGLAVTNLVSKGPYTRVFVEAYDDATGAVTLRYETVPPVCN
jgi:hypothetical protein